jgi:hypothetical protein
MRRKKLHIAFFLGLMLVFALLSFTLWPETSTNTQGTTLKRLTLKVEKSYVASDAITLNSSNGISITYKDSVSLYISSSYGSSVILPEFEKDKLTFTISSEITRKSGVIYWRLLSTAGASIDNGSFHITPSAKLAPILESYLGPPSIVAGGSDYSMMVIVGTDIYDNLLPNNTPVELNLYGNNSKSSIQKTTSDRIFWERIFSPETAGRMLISGSVAYASTNEKTLEINPNNAIDFNISEKLVHPYADGNQIAIFQTSIIKDGFNNIVSDGTLVKFMVTTSKNEKLEVSGATIQGVAKGQFLHPNEPVVWNAQAFAIGMAKSSVKKVSFQSVVEELNVDFSNDNRRIRVGPIQSYMGQIIPDGAKVELQIEGYDKPLMSTSRNGIVTFELMPALYENGMVDLTISTMGSIETFQKILN